MFLLLYLSYFKRKYHMEKRVYTKFHTPIVQVFVGVAVSCYETFSNRQSMKMERYNLRVKFEYNTENRENISHKQRLNMYEFVGKDV